MPRCRLHKPVLWATLGAVTLGFAGVVVGCTSSGGVRMFNEAPLAEGWPELTPVGEVQVKDYPQTRAAVVRDEAPDPEAHSEGDEAADAPVKSRAERRREMDGAFMKLFNHIKKHDIAMTSPVDMGYAEIDSETLDAEAGDAAPEQVSMAFLYRRTDQGESGEDGEVMVEDLPERTYVSIGVRGGYTDERFMENLKTLDAWLAENADAWTADGPPRYLGYNSPFVPPFMRYGEVQRPVRAVGGEADGSSSGE